MQTLLSVYFFVIAFLLTLSKCVCVWGGDGYIKYQRTPFFNKLTSNFLQNSLTFINAWEDMSHLKKNNWKLIAGLFYFRFVLIINYFLKFLFFLNKHNFFLKFFSSQSSLWVLRAEWRQAPSCWKINSDIKSRAGNFRMGYH